MACERNELQMTEAELANNCGGCVNCGNVQDGCEPDAMRYECEECGRRTVYGAEYLLLTDSVFVIRERERFTA